MNGKYKVIGMNKEGYNIKEAKLGDKIVYTSEKPYMISYEVAKTDKYLNDYYYYSGKKYYYGLPVIKKNSTAVEGINYEKIKITLLDGTVTNNLSTKMNQISKVELWYPETTVSLKFKGYNNLNPNYLTKILNINTKNFIDFSNMFSFCYNLKSLDLSNWDTSNVTNMNNMFDYCTNLISLDLSNWDTSNVTNMSYFLYYCSSLTSLDLSSFDTSNVTNMKGMFMGSTSLKSLDLSNFNTNKVSLYSSMFDSIIENWNYDGTNYKNFTLTEDDTGYDGVFPWNKYYVEYTISARNTTDTVNSYYTTSYYYYIPRIYTDSSNFSYDGYKYIEIEKNDGTITNSLSTLASDVAKIKIYYPKDTYTIKFYGYSSTYYPRIKTIEYMNTENFKEYSYLFRYCKLLEYIKDIEKWKNNTITTMQSMFYYCSSIISLDLSSWNTSNVTDISYMFYACDNLEYLDLSNWNTKKMTNKERAFYFSLNGEYNINKINWNYNGDNYLNFNFIESDVSYLGLFPWINKNYKYNYIIPINQHTIPSDEWVSYYRAEYIRDVNISNNDFSSISLTCYAYHLKETSTQTHLKITEYSLQSTGYNNNLLDDITNEVNLNIHFKYLNITNINAQLIGYRDTENVYNFCSKKYKGFINYKGKTENATYGQYNLYTNDISLTNSNGTNLELSSEFSFPYNNMSPSNYYAKYNLYALIIRAN